MSASIRTHLSKFSEELKVPAVAGSILSKDGTLNYDIVGVRRRGSNDKVEKHDKWHIGSCAKSITAVLYARLVEQGVANWDSPVASLFPDLTNQIADGWQNRTIEELFLCEAGMQANPTKAAMLSGYTDTRPLIDQRTEASLVAMRKAPRPSGSFVYSNLSYMVIGAAIDRITGIPFEDALEKYVLVPLSITSLGYGPPPMIWGHKPRVQIGNLALFVGKPANPKDVRSDNPRMLSSAGAMHMTITDWAKFLSLFLIDNSNILRPETIDFLLKNPKGSGTRMAKGWAKAEGLKNASFGMQGSNTMWAATALLDENRTSLSFLVCNDGRTHVLSQSARLAARLLTIDPQ